MRRRPNGSIARYSAPGEWSVTNVKAVRQSSASRSSRRVRRDGDEARVRLADGRPRRRRPPSARGAAPRARWRSPPGTDRRSPPPARAASAVVAAAIAVAHGIAGDERAALVERDRVRADELDLLERDVAERRRGSGGCEARSRRRSRAGTRAAGRASRRPSRRASSRSGARRSRPRRRRSPRRPRGSSAARGAPRRSGTGAGTRLRCARRPGRGRRLRWASRWCWS